MKTQSIRVSDVAKCPKHSMLGAHYYEDGRCRCLERADAKREIARLEVKMKNLRRKMQEAQAWLDSC